LLPQADTLHTFAEVGVGIAGFAGIVAVVDRRVGRRAENAADPLAVLLIASLGVVLFAFIPEWVASANVPTDIVWRASNGLFGAYRLAYLGIILLSAGRPPVGFQGRLALTVGAGLGGLHLVAAAGVLTEFHYFIYLSGLIWGLGVSVSNFARLLLGAAHSGPAA